MYALLIQQPWPLQIVEIFGIFITRAAILAGGSTAWIRLSKWAERHRVVQEDTSCKSIWTDVADGALILMIDTIVTVIFSFQLGWLKGIIDSTPLQFFATFIGLFVWMEIYFYYSHRLLHHPKLFWIHRRHHERRATNPWTSLSFSASERIILLVGAVLIPSAVSQFVPLSLAGYFGYYLFNYIFNVYGHLNVETVPHWMVQTKPGKILMTTTFHGLHHARSRGHYGLFTQVLDRTHGTHFKDYESYHQHVMERV